MHRVLATMAAVTAVVVAIFIYAKRRAVLELRAKQLKADAKKIDQERDAAIATGAREASVKLNEIAEVAAAKEAEIQVVEKEIKSLDTTKSIADAWNKRRAK